MKGKEPTAEYIRSLHDKDLEILLAMHSDDCPEKESASKWPNWLRKLIRKGQ